MAREPRSEQDPDGPDGATGTDGEGPADGGSGVDDDGGASAETARAHTAQGIAAAWERERPGTPVSSIRILTPVWQLAKLFGDDRRRVLARAGVDAATLDLLSVLRRSGPPYTLSTRELGRRSLVTAGAVSQRVARAEQEGLVTRGPARGRSRTVLVTLTPAGHDLVEATVDQVLHRDAELVAGLTPEQQAQLTGLLEVLLTDVQRRLGDDRIGHVGDR
ncbi:MarR family winged helix-turn-helix transcriptional regulator [Streptomyces alboflavus]|uniref:MarR family transcriptional regulator n=1 Tax=Streptomyces alboflavus TaxID=67267 RepID=A0A1Z1W5K7_9ACTN|nr:MarR family transcriptional regulator [Streptomyces alboflavus]ARX81687.1 MarR family transcriptional regulator [Streptomyces alboflavus]